MGSISKINKYIIQNVDFFWPISSPTFGSDEVAPQFFIIREPSSTMKRISSSRIWRIDSNTANTMPKINIPFVRQLEEEINIGQFCYLHFLSYYFDFRFHFDFRFQFAFHSSRLMLAEFDLVILCPAKRFENRNYEKFILFAQQATDEKSNL